MSVTYSTDTTTAGTSLASELVVQSCVSANIEKREIHKIYLSK